MSTNTIDTQKTPETSAPLPKGKRAAAKKAKPAKNKARAKKASGKPKTDRANKKAEVIASMKRAKGATLAEIMAATAWQAHTVRGFVSILGSKGGEKIESSKNAVGERTYQHRQIASAIRFRNAASRCWPGPAFPLCWPYIARM